MQHSSTDSNRVDELANKSKANSGSGTSSFASFANRPPGALPQQKLPLLYGRLSGMSSICKDLGIQQGPPVTAWGPVIVVTHKGKL
ncbi:hypothetical protein STEG23_031030, partial [Scotinomys teguina]